MYQKLFKGLFHLQTSFKTSQIISGQMVSLKQNSSLVSFRTTLSFTLLALHSQYLEGIKLNVACRLDTSCVVLFTQIFTFCCHRLN